MVLSRLCILWVLGAAGMAAAQRDLTREALTRLETRLTLNPKDAAALSPQELLPIMVVSTAPLFEETKSWYPTEALASLVRVFGPGAVRLCEACMVPRLHVHDGKVEQLTQGLSAPEIAQFDESLRGQSLPAKTAVWLDETMTGVSLRIINLASSRVVWAENFGPGSAEVDSVRRMAKLEQEKARRERGDALMHTFIDFGVAPHQHITLDWSEQWGDTNANLTGVTFSLLDPVLGIGGSYARIIPEVLNLTVGLQVLISLPTALVQSVTQDAPTLIDPLFNVAAVVRLPLFKTNFALFFSVSTNAKVAIGISLLNVTFLPVIL